MSKSFRTSFRKTVCNCQLYAKNEEPMATQWEHEGKGEEVEIQPQICCNHRNTAVLTNNHGLRINHSRGALNRYVVRMNMTFIWILEEGSQTIGWVPKFATGLNIIIGCRSKSIWVTRLLFCQNDSPIWGSFWQKDSLITHILFELCLLWYLAQSQILGITLYFR